MKKKMTDEKIEYIRILDELESLSDDYFVNSAEKMYNDDWFKEDKISVLFINLINEFENLVE